MARSEMTAPPPAQPTQAAPVPSLEYAPTPPWHERPRGWRRFLWVTGTLLLAYFASSFGPTLLHRAQLLYWQKRCMNHTYPANAVVADASTAVVPEEWVKYYTLATGNPPASSGTV